VLTFLNSYCSEWTCDLVASLERIGLNNVRTLVKLMCLTAAGRIQCPSDGDDEETRHYNSGGSKFETNDFSHLPYDLPTCTKLQHIGKAVEVLTSSDFESAKLVLEMCTRVS
jgi:hypothetical protein